MKTKVVAAMSGGVDSSVAAALLQRQGYEVIGITMCFGLKESISPKPSCCGLEGIEDAQKVASKLGIRHYVLNFNKVLEEKVINDFLKEYAKGRTPNPCIRCNQYLKFGHLLNKARTLGARYLATGHYARIEFDKTKRLYRLKKAQDKFKDQSYFLYRLSQAQMRHSLFPLGNIHKEKVRRIASGLGLPVADKPASQEICFVPEGDYRLFLKRKAGLLRARISPGLILDARGNILGRHKGISFYTVGQREGLGVAKGYPLYVIEINSQDNSLVLGRRQEAMSCGLTGKGRILGSYPLKRAVVLKAKIRYNHQEVLSKVRPVSRGRFEVIFSQPQFAVCPGQAVVFYKDDEVAGGGVIERALSSYRLKKICRI